MLADEEDGPFCVQRDNADRLELRMDDAVDARPSVGAEHLVVVDLDPRVLVCDAAMHPLPWSYTLSHRYTRSSLAFSRQPICVVDVARRRASGALDSARTIVSSIAGRSSSSAGSAP